MKDIYWNSEEPIGKEQEFKSSHGESNDSHGNANSNNVVEVVNNRIFYYSVVDRGKVLKLNKAILALGVSITHRSMHLEVEPPPIRLHINSYGGSVFSGFAAIDYILQSKVPVHTVIDGCAASAATMMSIVGSKRSMHRNAFMLIHQLSSGMWGNHRQLTDEMENCDMLMEKIRELYRRHTKIPKKQLDDMLKHDLWWDAETCLRYGLVDEII